MLHVSNRKMGRTQMVLLMSSLSWPVMEVAEQTTCLQERVATAPRGFTGGRADSCQAS